MRDEDTLRGTVLTPEEKTKLELIQCSLSVAVPLYIEQWRFRDTEERLARAEECAQVVTEHGDVILYRGRKDGETARAFNAFAEGVALCSFAPGGVTIFGLHFEACAHTRLSQAEWERRKPPPPDELVDALHDRVHRDPGRARPARTIRSRRDGA